MFVRGEREREKELRVPEPVLLHGHIEMLVQNCNENNMTLRWSEDRVWELTELETGGKT